MTHGSLFSGIGGFDLAAEIMGWHNKFHCEWNEFGQKILHYYWPNAEQFTDITKSNFTKYANKIDILTGGFPCQPYSSAGKRLGTADNRHLWPEMLRAIKEIQPRWVVGENVRGITNWNGGLVFDEVQADLEAIGYETIPFILPACAINAPHRRDRVWFIAYAVSTKQRANEFESVRFKNGETNKKRAQAVYNDIRPNGDKGTIADTKSNRQKYRLQNKKLERTRFRELCKRDFWDAFPSVPPICVRNDGFSNKLDGITFPKWRQESLKAAGNAIVPQIALQIFKAIKKFETLNKKQ